MSAGPSVLVALLTYKSVAPPPQAVSERPFDQQMAKWAQEQAVREHWTVIISGTLGALMWVGAAVLAVYLLRRGTKAGKVMAAAATLVILLLAGAAIEAIGKQPYVMSGLF